MTPLHAHFAVDDLAAGVHFYSMMFASAPAVLMPDYAKWMLDDPRVAFAISRRRVTSSMRYAASVCTQRGCIPKT